MWSSIKSILRDNKTRCVVIEDGKPAYVIVSFEEYQQLQKGGNDSIVRENNWSGDPAQSPRGIEAGPPQFSEADLGGEEGERVNGEIQDASTIRIEDLPF